MPRAASFKWMRSPIHRTGIEQRKRSEFVPRSTESVPTARSNRVGDLRRWDSLLVPLQHSTTPALQLLAESIEAGSGRCRGGCLIPCAGEAAPLSREIQRAYGIGSSVASDAP